MKISLSSIAEFNEGELKELYTDADGMGIPRSATPVMSASKRATHMISVCVLSRVFNIRRLDAP